MASAARSRRPQPFRVPSTIEGRPLCRVSHQAPRGECPTYTEYFKHGDAIPDRKCDIHGGASAAEVIGTIFSRIGKGIGRIFGR